LISNLYLKEEKQKKYPILKLLDTIKHHQVIYSVDKLDKIFQKASKIIYYRKKDFTIRNK
jgi:hypothetical protein